MENQNGRSKILKSIIIVVLILVLLIVIHIIRNYNILKDIASKREENQKANNYSYTLEAHEHTNEHTKSEHYYKDGKRVVKGDNTLYWADVNNNESITISYDNNVAIIRKNGSSYLYRGMPATPGNASIGEALTNFISTKKVNGVECYVIGDAYISKKDGTLIRIQMRRFIY